MNDDRERVRDSNPLPEVMEEYFPLLPDGAGRFKALCPFHREKTPSFKVDAERGSYYCFGCGERGDVFSFVMRMDNLEFREALAQLASRVGIELDGRPGTGENFDVRKRDLELLERATAWFEAQLQATTGADAREYLRRRGFDTATIARFRVGFAPPGWQNFGDVLDGWYRGGLEKEAQARALALGLVRESKTGRTYDGFRNRIMFPIRTPQGRVVGFGGRVLVGSSPPESSDEDRSEEPKYINSPESPLFRKGQLLYGHLEGRDTIRRDRRLLLMEGYTDVMMAQQSGFGGAVATLGTALAEPNVETIARHADQVVLVFDGDTAGRRAAIKALRLLLPRPLDVRVAALPSGVDPCDLLTERRESFQRAIDDASEGFEFAARELAAEVGLTDRSPGSVKEQAARAAFEFLDLLDSEIRREAGLRALATQLQVSDRVLMTEYRRRRGGASAASRPERQVSVARVAGTTTSDRRRGTDEEWILLGALSSAEWAKPLLRLHPPAQFAAPRFRAIAERLWENDGVLDPLDLEDLDEKAALLELNEKLESARFDEERACQLLSDLLVRWLGSYYERLVAVRGRGESSDEWTQPDTEAKSLADQQVRRLLEVRGEITRLKGAKNVDWKALSEVADRWLADPDACDHDPSGVVVTPAGEGYP